MTEVERCADFLANGTSNATSMSKKLLISFGKKIDKEGKEVVNEHRETPSTDEMHKENSGEKAAAKRQRRRRKKKVVGSVSNAENGATGKGAL